jgi:hypothetical protein
MCYNDFMKLFESRTQYLLGAAALIGFSIASLGIGANVTAAIGTMHSSTHMHQIWLLTTETGVAVQGAGTALFLAAAIAWTLYESKVINQSLSKMKSLSMIEYANERRSPHS